MRGARVPGADAHAPSGIIPAYAGSTLQGRAKTCQYRDHPRVCGEHALAGGTSESGKGSSPRMRGAPLGSVKVLALGGIIPAYAGSTSGAPPAATRRWDHPRICGEHHGRMRPARRFRGSSPHMRGALPIAYISEAVAGIIPAYAGSTRLMYFDVGYQWDHPRICGEHLVICTAPIYVRGSSPHMRGAPRPTDTWLLRVGIIPAYAGSTNRYLVLIPSTWDHPCICGEHKERELMVTEYAGSSPHMRGALQGDRT